MSAPPVRRPATARLLDYRHTLDLFSIRSLDPEEVGSRRDAAAALIRSVPRNRMRTGGQRLRHDRTHQLAARIEQIDADAAGTRDPEAQIGPRIERVRPGDHVHAPLTLRERAAQDELLVEAPRERLAGGERAAQGQVHRGLPGG